jgi:hypothetical protein
MRPRLLAFKTSSDGVLYCSSDTFKPPVLYTCKESRKEGLKFYQILHPAGAPWPCRVYFNSHIDTIFCQFRYDNYTAMNAPHVSELECWFLETVISAEMRYLAIPWGLWVDMRVRAKYITLYNHIRSSKLLEEVTLVELRRPKLADVYRIVEFKEIEGLTNGYGFNSWGARAEEEAKQNPKWTVPKIRYVRVKYKDRMGEGWNNKSSLLQPLEFYPHEDEQTIDANVEREDEKDETCHKSALVPPLEVYLMDERNPAVKSERENNKGKECDSKAPLSPPMEASHLLHDQMPVMKFEREDY